MDQDNGDGGKPRLELSDIMSILGEGEPKKATVAKKPEAQKAQAVKPQENTSRDNAFAAKLLTDIEQKNVEILRLNTEIMNLKYELKEKEMMLKKQASDLDESIKKLEETTRKLDEANVKLGEMDADRAKLKIKATADDAPEEAPPEEDVASIFKRLTKSEELSEGNDPGNVNPDKPHPPRKTAKLYDL